jgi:hypothetical protein
MEPAVAATAYTAETTLEGAVVGAIALAKPTLPIAATLTPLPPLPSLPPLSSHTLSVISNRAYIFGGDTLHPVLSSKDANALNVLTLPTDPALGHTDYKILPASNSSGGEGDLPASRAGHAATTIDNRIYIFGGRVPSAHKATHSAPLDESAKVHAFSTATSTWRTLTPQPVRCAHGFPLPRTYASLTSSPHPLPSKKDQDFTMSPVGIEDPEDSGTLFLHGGMDASGAELHDTWAYDIGSGTWSPWPEAPGHGLIYYEDGSEGEKMHGGRLWWVGTSDKSAGDVAFLAILTERFDDGSGVGELGVAPGKKGWEFVFGGPSDSTAPAPSAPETKEATAPTSPSTTDPASERPSPRKGAHLLPVTTGQGRRYLLLLFGTGESSTWAFQLPSHTADGFSAAKLKDQMRSALGKETSEGKWARVDMRVDVSGSGAGDGPLERKVGELLRDKVLKGGLGAFGADKGGDCGRGRVVGWGGIKEGEVRDGGWFLSVE